jgi:hypothetical protein
VRACRETSAQHGIAQHGATQNAAARKAKRTLTQNANTNPKKGALLHDCIEVGRAPADLASARVNIVLVRRPELAAAHSQRAAELARRLARDAGSGGDVRTVPLGGPVALPVPVGSSSSSSSSGDSAAAAAAAAADDLVALLAAHDAALAALVASDALELAAALAAALHLNHSHNSSSNSSNSSGLEGWWGARQTSPPPPRQQQQQLRAKLELIAATTCPNWHADTVGARALVTYAGPGTLLVPNSAARRKWALDGTAAVAGVDEAQAVQAAPFDALYLKGGAAAGMHGMGAVHKSPAGASVGEPRLLLTVDDVPLCACC